MDKGVTKGKILPCFARFQCIGRECSLCCCRGFEIYIDPVTTKKMKENKMPLCKKLFFRMIMMDTEDGGAMLRKCFGRCPFYNKEGDCKLQKKNMEDYLPYVCDIYPRKYFQFDHYIEVGMELSCPETFRMLLHEYWDGENAFTGFELCDYPLDKSYVYQKKNDEKEFLLYLLDKRNQWVSNIAKSDFSSLNAIRELYYQLYEEAYFENSRLAGVDLKDTELPQIGNKDGFFFGLDLINHVIINFLSKDYYKSTNPPLYKALQGYLKLYGNLNIEEAENIITTKVNHMLEDHDFAGFLRIYLSHHVHQDLLESFSDYYILGPMLMSILKCEIVVILLSTQYEEKSWMECGENRKEMIRKLLLGFLPSFERATSHNLKFQKKSLQLIRFEFRKNS